MQHPLRFASAPALFWPVIAWPIIAWPVIVWLVLVLTAPSARADWPLWRYDAQRTATARGPTNIGKPTPYWRSYLGGSLSARTYLAHDVNTDGKVEIVYVSGGKVIAKLPNDVVVWETPARDIHTLVGVEDLDGDGALEVIAFAQRKAYVLSGQTGAILWEEAEGEMGTISLVRLGDLDGDGLADLYISECGCCAVKSATPGVAYSFAAGFKNVTPKWVAPAHPGCNSRSVTLGDFDGDGVLDVGISTYKSGVLLLAGKTGAVLGTSASLGPRCDFFYCEARDVDAKPGDELICFMSDYFEGSQEGGHRVLVARYEATATPNAVQVLWQRETTSKLDGQLAWTGHSVVDLDSDGKLEIVIAERDSGPWSTRVLDAATGVELAALPGELLQVVADLDGDGKPEIVTRVSAGGALRASNFARSAALRLSQRWVFGDNTLSVRTQQDWQRWRRTSNSLVTPLLDIDGDKVRELVLVQSAKGGAPAQLAAYRASGPNPSVLVSHTIGDDVSVLTLGVFAAVDRPYDQLLFAQSDGHLVVLDKAFKATNAQTDSEFVIPGLRVGGYYSGAYGPGQEPIAPRLDGSADAVLVRDSRGYVLRLDAQGATLITPPKRVWELAGASHPSAIPGLDQGKPAIALVKSGVSLYAGDGTLLWAKNPGGGVLFDVLPGDANGDGAQDVFVKYETAGRVMNHNVLDGQSGAPLWTAPFSEAVVPGFEPFAVADHDGDGKADLYAVTKALHVRSGVDGSELAATTQTFSYFMPVIADIDFDGVPEVTLTCGYQEVRSFKKDLVTELWKGGLDKPYAAGAAVECPNQRMVWVQSSLERLGELKLITMNGSDTGQQAVFYLAEGQRYAKEADAAGKFRGVLGNVAIQPALRGPGSPPGALVGSTDGWLYAIDPCTAMLTWSYDFGFPVGEPILADTSGSGQNQIIVAVQDGYLYGLAQQWLEAPAWVHDIDPPGGVTNDDVDTIFTYQTLYARWAAVADADSYEVAVVTPGGSFLTQPPWQNVGAVTETKLAGLPLSDGKRYLVAVRAVAAGKGASPVTSSDGVTVQLGPKPQSDAGPDPDSRVPSDGGGDGDASTTPPTTSSGCGCEVGDQPAPLALWALLVFAIVMLGRRGWSASAPTSRRAR